MANVRILCYAIFGILLQFNKCMARTSTSIIEAYKPTTSTTTKTKDETREEENLNKLDKMLITLEHKIQDINFRRRIMEQQRKFPINSFNARMEAALDITDLSPSIVYTNQKIVSGNGVFLQIFPNGNANGTRDDSSPYSKKIIFFNRYNTSPISVFRKRARCFFNFFLSKFNLNKPLFDSFFDQNVN